MVIPSHSPEPSNPPAPSPFQPELPYSAAAEAAALTSLSFHIPKTSPLTKRRYGILPQKVKRPPNAYLLFNRDMRRQLHDDNQGLSSGEISKTISLRWKQLSPAEKEYYLNEESKLKQQHTNSIYSRRSKAELKEAGVVERKKPDIYPAKKKPSLVIAGRDPRGRKKKKADDNLPKHPMSAYLHFAKEIRPIMKRRYPEARLVDISREIGHQWRSMSPLELQPWVEIANRDKERYANEMKERILQQEHQQTMLEDTCSSSSSSTSSPISIQHFPLDHHYRVHPIV
ncbi:high mobility group box domain-containing protein [Choanephora cucurbitarum]|nr:high mobility group box domain-containing protein [Choanephora cucurbitarum]